MYASVCYTSLLLQVLSDAGILPGGDMTAEAALAKLSYLLAKKNLTQEQRRQVNLFTVQRIISSM